MENKVFDTVIIGGGPSGLSAAIYAARGGLETLLLEKAAVGGLAILTDKIENYPGFPEGISGAELIMLFEKQARRFGARIESGIVKEVRQEPGEPFEIIASSGSFKARSVIIAAGTKPRKLNVPGEQEFTGRGVSYCATCDAPFFRDKIVAVAGGGNAAVEEALFLTRFASKVYLIHRRDRLRAAAAIRGRAEKNDKLEFIWNSAVKEIAGAGSVERVRIENLTSGAESELECSGVFVFIGYEPSTEAFAQFVERDENGFIKTEGAASSRPGIFASGDCVKKPLFQVLTAAATGAEAAFAAVKFVENLKGEAYE